VRRQNQRMSRKDDQPSAARAAAFLQRKKRRLVATVLRFLRNRMKQNKQKRLFGVGFFGTFLPSKKYRKINFLGESR
jgi:hypothetical protein